MTFLKLVLKRLRFNQCSLLNKYNEQAEQNQNKVYLEVE